MGQLTHQTKTVMSIKPQAQGASATFNGIGVDTAGYDDAMVVMMHGTATGTVDCKVQDSADNSSFADVAGAAFVQITPSNDDTMFLGRLRCDGTVRRYLRVVSVTAASSSSLIAAAIVLGDPNLVMPDAANASVAFNITI